MEVLLRSLLFCTKVVAANTVKAVNVVLLFCIDCICTASTVYKLQQLYLDCTDCICSSLTALL